MMHENGLATYRDTAVQTSSPTKLVIMLYEGSVRFLCESVAAIQSGDLDRKRHTIDRAVAIVQHLQSALDMERGQEVAANLNRLYTYIIGRILEGSANLQTAPLEEAIKLLNTLLTAWEELARQETVNNVSPGLMGRPTATGGFTLHA